MVDNMAKASNEKTSGTLLLNVSPDVAIEELYRQERLAVAFRYLEWYRAITVLVQSSDGPVHYDVPEQAEILLHRCLDYIDDTLTGRILQTKRRTKRANT